MTLDDRIKQSIEDALGTARLPPGNLGAVEQHGHRLRRRHRRHAAVGAAVGVLAVTVGAATLTRAVSDADPASTSPRTIECAGEIIQTTPRDQPRVPSFATPLEAAQGWAGPDAGRLVMDGNEVAFLLREDGSVRARMRLESSRSDLEDNEPTAWTVDGSQTCDDETAPGPWQGAGLLECPMGQPVLADVRYEDDDEVGYFPTEPEGFAIDARDDSQILKTPGALSGDVTSTTGRGGNVHTVVRLLRVADLWRITQIAECASQAPGVAPAPSATPVEVVNLRTGHCWIDPLQYDGRSWEVRAKDDFGDGGGGDLWHGFGAVAVTNDEMTYVDLGGTELTLLPSGDPRIAEKTVCA